MGIHQGWWTARSKPATLRCAATSTTADSAAVSAAENASASDS
jgi:hypothetical protein